MSSNAKPPPIPNRPPRPRAFVQELPIGKPPILHPDTSARLVALNNALIRDIQTELKLPDGRPWGSPAITVLRIAVAQALERAAKYGMLAVYEEARRQAVKNITAPPARVVVAEDPQFDQDATTRPMRFKPLNLGDE